LILNTATLPDFMRPDHTRPRLPRRRSGAVLFSLVALPAAAAAQEPAAPAPRAPVKLDELVVTAAGFEQDRANAPASVTVLTREELTRKRVSSLAEALATVEGIDVGGRVGKTGGLNVSLRGMPSDYTLILVDGRRQNAAGNVTPNGFGETATSFLPPVSAIERIEVIRGPMSTLYGSDAMGGVINIITRRVPRRWTGSLTSDVTVQEVKGYGDSRSASAAAQGPLVPGLLGVAARGSLFRRDASELSPSGEFGAGTEISRRGPSPVEGDIYSVGGRVSLTPGRGHEIWFDADRSRQRYDNSAAQLGTLDRPDGNPATFNGYGPELRFHRDQWTLAHAWRFGGSHLATSLMRNATETLGRTLPQGTPGGPPGSGAPDKTPGAPRTLEAVSTVLDSKLTSSLGAHVFTLGGQYWDADMTDGVALQPFEQTQWSVFAEDEWRFAPRLALTVGVRRDDHTAFGSNVSPRAYLVWNVRPEWTLKGGLSGGYKTPRLEQLQPGIIGFTRQGRTAAIGTPGLRPETSRTTEVGAHYSGASGLQAGVTVFHNAFRDKIAAGVPVPNCTFAGAPDRPGCVDYGDFPTQESFAQSVNVDRARTRGAEASLRLPLAGWLALSGNYTFTDGEQLSGDSHGFPLAETPDHMLNGALRATPGDRLTGWLQGEYRSERARRITSAADPVYVALGDYRAYSLFHLGGGYRVGRGVSVSATVHNLLNRDFLRYAAYEVPVTAENPAGIEYASLYNNHQEGRRLWLSTTIEF
jgi:outer membrane receptor for ferrienterochelin and colicins